MYAGVASRRKRLDPCLLDRRGEPLERGAAPADGDGLRSFARGVAERHGPVAVCAAIGSMYGVRSLHDTLERCGWDVEVADAEAISHMRTRNRPFAREAPRVLVPHDRPF